MPFLKTIKVSYANKKIQSAKRNGFRHAIFSPRKKQPFQGYYIGEWLNDIKEGRGKELDRNGWIYEGYWHNNERHGCGTLSKISKQDHTIRRHYIGEWYAGKKQGFGHNWFEDGSYYEGAFCRNKRHGYGRMWHCNGDYYEGDWDNDLYHGLGLLITDIGNKYEGHFFKGKKHGNGTFYHIITGQKQHGLWANDFFINGIMMDMDFRQAALHPTPYPIPPVKLMMEDGCSQNVDIVDVHDADATGHAFVDNFCKRRRKRIVGNFCVPLNACPCPESVT